MYKGTGTYIIFQLSTAAELKSFLSNIRKFGPRRTRR